MKLLMLRITCVQAIGSGALHKDEALIWKLFLKGSGKQMVGRVECLRNRGFAKYSMQSPYFSSQTPPAHVADRIWLSIAKPQTWLPGTCVHAFARPEKRTDE